MINGDKILVFYSSTNAKGRHDATGAFIPEAKKFQREHSIPLKNMIPVECVGIRKGVRRTRVLEELSQRESLQAIAFFGHGWPKGIQFGFGKQHIQSLSKALAESCVSSVKIILYACLAAENDIRDGEIGAPGPATDGGFADELRDQMVREGLRTGHVDAHKTAGHTSWNPYVVRFKCDNVMSDTYGAVGGAWLVEPSSESWKSWVKALRSKNGLRYRFPFMSELEIKSELSGE